jgi:hypothetical protein
MLAKSILALAAMLTASAPSGDDGAANRQRFFLSCAGTMRVADGPETAIMAEAFFDLALQRVDGFGVTAVPIVLVTDEVVVFEGNGGRYGERVTGAFHRRTGKASVTVLTAGEPPSALIEMALDCSPAASIS